MKNGKCSAIVSHHGMCSNKAEFLVFYFMPKRKQWYSEGFCEDHAYEFSMYYSNYMGLKTRVVELRKREKVEFT